MNAFLRLLTLLRWLVQVSLMAWAGGALSVNNGEKSVIDSSVVAGAANGFAIDSSGRLLGWGNDSAGQLGVGRKILSSSQLLVGHGYQAVSARGNQTFAFKSDGTLCGMGGNMSGQLGDGTTTTRSSCVQIEGSFTTVSVGDFHTVAMKSDGSLWAWGANESGQLGDGTWTSSTVPKQIVSGFSSVLAAWRHTVAIKKDGTLWAWGHNVGGQLGDGTTTFRNAPVQIGSGFVTIAAGDSHTVALKTDGSLWAWGFNRVGQLGDGTTNSSLIPKQIGDSYTSIAAAKNATLALKKDGSLWEWGSAPGLVSSLVPFQVGRGFVRFVAGKNHVLALKQDGSLWAWGSNAMGQLGDNSSNDSNIPILVGQGYSAISAGDFHSAALKTDGSLWAWGSNSLGQLGDAATTQSNYPKLIDTDFTTLAVGGGLLQYVSDTHIVALKQDGSLWSWGSNNRGQLGDGTVIPSNIPKQIGKGYSAIAAGLFFTIALKANGDLWGWGTNVYGQLGNDVTNTAFLPPTLIGSGYRSVTVGGEGNGFTLAIKTDDTLWAWGSNASGQLGDGTTTNRSMPTLIGTGFSTVAAGNSHTIAIKTDGTLWAWGGNSSGQFGDGTTTHSLLPRQVGSGYDVVTAGLQFTAAIKQNGTLWAWGRNEYGQLGDGSIVNSSVPKLIGNGFSAVSAGQYHMQAVKSDGTVWATGNNFFGQMGDGTLASKHGLSPVVNQAVDGTLDLIPEIANGPMAELEEPPFLVKTEELAKMNVEIKYDDMARNKDGLVYVTAYLPANSPVLAGKPASDSLNSELVSVVLTRSGWKQATPDNETEAYDTGLLNDTKTFYGLFDASKFDRKNSEGVFCVGYSAGEGTKSAKGLSRAIVTGGNTEPKCPTLKVAQSLRTVSLGVAATGTGFGRVISNPVGIDCNSTCSAAFSSGRAVTLTATPNQGSQFNGWSGGECSGTGSCTMTLSTAMTVTANFTLSMVNTYNIGVGWNLLGNGVEATLNVATTFSDTSKVATVWKWLKSGKWAYFNPSLADGGKSLAVANGYDTLTAIQAGEGFWVNAKGSFALTLPTGTVVTSSSFTPGSGSHALVKQWNLIATGDKPTPATFNNHIGSLPTDVVTLWAWDANKKSWYFWASSLSKDGGLPAFLAAKGYLDFTTLPTTPPGVLSPTAGFWVRMP
jgi:alpha-tubulin suppressor-like RCC1 family protein